MARQTTGIRIRHLRGCDTAAGGQCSCKPGPSVEAWVWSPLDKRKIRRTFTGKGTESAAKRWRTDAGSAVNRRALRAPSPTTLREAFDAFLAGARNGSIRTRKGRKGRVYKSSVLRRWESALIVKRDSAGQPVSKRKKGEPERIGRSLLDDLGGRKLTDFDRNLLQDLVVDRMLGWGLSASTIQNTVNALRAVFARAVTRGELLVNPTAGLEVPTSEKKRDRIAPPDEAAKLIAALPGEWRALWATAFYAGLRLGELLALRWEDVDLASGVIRVERAYDYVEREFIYVKTTAGFRKVPIAAALRDILLDHKLDAGRDTGLVFGRTAELPAVYQTIRRHAAKAWAKAALDLIGLHEARHTFASLMIDAGVNIKAISTFMGHASVKITLDRYGHLMPDAEEEAAARLDAYLERASAKARGAQGDGETLEGLVDGDRLLELARDLRQSHEPPEWATKAGEPPSWRRAALILARELSQLTTGARAGARSGEEDGEPLG